MSKRFGVRKIKIRSYSHQGWLISQRESFAVYDRKWKDVARAMAQARAKGCSIFDDYGKRHMYVEHTAFNNKDFVKAVADYLNQTVGDDISKRFDGYQAYNAVLVRDLGKDKIGCYAEWCDKFSAGFRPTEKFQKV